MFGPNPDSYCATDHMRDAWNSHGCFQLPGRLHGTDVAEHIAIVRCRGRIVFGEEADELRRVVLSLLNETKRIVLNFAWVGYIDSSGVGTVVASFISARHRGAEIKFAALSPVAGRVLRTTHVDSLFEVYDSNEDAIKSFRPRPEAAAG